MASAVWRFLRGMTEKQWMLSFITLFVLALVWFVAFLFHSPAFFVIANLTMICAFVDEWPRD
jgi:hypothetical protein